MKTLFKILPILALIAVFPVQAQTATNVLVSTTLAASSGPRSTELNLTSVTGINAPTAGVPASMLYVIDKGERVGQLFQVSSLNGNNVKVTPRGSGAVGNAHGLGALVLIATVPNWFYTSNPNGPCANVGGTTCSTIPLVNPWLNTNTGEQWIYSTVTNTWTPGWNTYSAGGVPTTAVASVAGATVPSGPFFHITGTNAITSFTLPLGFAGGQFCAVADAIWTWTAAGNIAVAGTTTAAGRRFCFQYDVNSAKWYPDKII